MSRTQLLPMSRLDCMDTSRLDRIREMGVTFNWGPLVDVRQLCGFVSTNRSVKINGQMREWTPKNGWLPFGFKVPQNPTRPSQKECGA